MASSYYPRQAFDYAKVFVKNMPLETIGVRILDDISKLMWIAAPWRWSVGNLAPIPLISNTQDYTLTTPSNLVYLLHSYISDGSGVVTHLDVVPTQNPNVGIYGNPRFISYEGSNLYRISPNPGSLPSTPTRNIYSWYKKSSPTLKASNISTAGVLLFDDEYFPVYEAGVLWQAYLYADDQRAGSTTVDSQGRAQYTGQRAVFESMLNAMKSPEALPVFEHQTSAEQRETQG